MGSQEWDEQSEQVLRDMELSAHQHPCCCLSRPTDASAAQDSNGSDKPDADNEATDLAQPQSGTASAQPQTCEAAAPADNGEQQGAGPGVVNAESVPVSVPPQKYTTFRFNVLWRSVWSHSGFYSDPCILAAAGPLSKWRSYFRGSDP